MIHKPEKETQTKQQKPKNNLVGRRVVVLWLMALTKRNYRNMAMLEGF